MRKVLLAFLLIFSTITYSDGHKKLEFWGQFSLAPTKFIDEDGNMTGINYDIIKEISRRVEVPIEMKNVPWKRLIKGAETGAVDGVFAAYDTKERREFAHYFSVPLHYGQYVIFVKKGNKFKYNSLDDLHDKVVSRNLGFFVTNEFEEKIKAGKFRLDESRATEAGFKKLLTGRIDVYIMTKLEGLYTAKQMGILDKIEILSTVGESKGAYLIISKKAKIQNKQTVINSIEKALVEMKNDGTIDSIYNKYTE